MKATLVVGAFLAAILIALPLFALAGPGDPIPGIEVGLEHDPCGQPCKFASQTKTNSEGVAVFRNVTPGKYRLMIGTIAWKSVGRGSISTKSRATFEIDVPGQTRIVQTIYQADANSMKNANARLAPFNVRGGKLQTVTVTIWDRWGNCCP